MQLQGRISKGNDLARMSHNDWQPLLLEKVSSCNGLRFLTKCDWGVRVGEGAGTWKFSLLQNHLSHQLTDACSSSFVGGREEMSDRVLNADPMLALCQGIYIH